MKHLLQAIVPALFCLLAAVAHADLQEKHDEHVKKLSAAYTKSLKTLQEEQQKAGDLKAALAIRKEIKSFATKPLSKEQLAALHPAITPLRTKFDTALQQAAATLAAKPKGSPPPAQATPPPSKPANATSTPVLVAKSIVARGSISGTAKNVIGFDGPRGDGRIGAKGILVKMDPEARDTGSTWMLDYSLEHRNTRGLQIIHPRSKGHAVIHINRGGIGTSTPENWSKIGYRSHGSSAKMKKAAENFFPLEDNRTYAIVSRMESNGGLEVYIDGVLVATERVRAAKRLSLGDPDDPPFKGNDLPMQWKSNSAGIIVGPRDAGSHAAKNVRYCPAPTPVPTP